MINLDAFEAYVRILVVGVGGGGSNAVNAMVDQGMTDKIDFYVFNTDAQALATSKSPNRLVLGEEITKGLGAGGDPEVGRKAAEASKERIKEIVSNYDMVFIACGEGGGTGTGAAPIVGQIAKESGALTLAIVTRPFTFEGNARIKKASEGILKIKESVDSLIIISNDKLMFMNGKRPISEAFNESDKVLAQDVRTITDLILLPGIINLDFADIKSTLKDKGMALIGFGTGSGEGKAKMAAANAVSCPLLETSIRGSKTAIVNVVGGDNVTLDEAQEAVRYITEIAGGDVNIKFGIQTNPQFNDEMLVSVIATDFSNEIDIANGNIPSNQVNTLINRNGDQIQVEKPNIDVDLENANPAQINNATGAFTNDDNVLPDFFKGMNQTSSDFNDNDNQQNNEDDQSSNNIPQEENI